MHRFATTLAALGLLVAGCGDCQGGPGTSTVPDEESPSDALDETDAVEDGAADGASIPDSTPDPDGSSTDGEGTGGGTDAGDPDDCPSYSSACELDGEVVCVDTSSDPDNCGACGNTCGSDQVCESGACVSECLAGRSDCDGACVDLDTSDAHCGSCGSACGSGQGCVNGTCREAVSVDPPPEGMCEGGGDPIDIEFDSGDTERCTGDVAQRTFRWGICSCGDIELSRNILVDAFDSKLGPYQPGGFGGSLGANGAIQIKKAPIDWSDLANSHGIFGTVWASGDSGIRTSNAVDVAQEVHSGGDLSKSAGGRYTVGRDVGADIVGGNGFVDGDVQGPGTFLGDLRYAGGKDRNVEVDGDERSVDSVDVPPPCDRCSEDARIPVRSIVDRHEGGANDNEMIGLDADALAQPGGQRALRLPCGEYYLSEIDTTEPFSIVATGHTALYIGGDVSAADVSDATIKAAPGAELDLFVRGSVDLNNSASFGSPARPASMRAYLGDEFVTKNDTMLGAYIYAVRGGVGTMNNAEIFGGVYTDALDAGGAPGGSDTNNNIDLHYDRAILEAGETCEDPPDDPGGGDTGPGDTGPGGETDADTGAMDGGDGGMCTPSGESCDSSASCCSQLVCDSSGTCAECRSAREACDGPADCCTSLTCSSGACCVESGGSCSSDGDCCSPLTCSGGTCTSTGCNNLFESCSSDGDCCSGNCVSGACVSG